MLVTVDVALALHRPVNDVVEILPRLVVRRDDERRMRLLDVLVRDRVQAFLAWTDFVHATLLVEAFDRTVDITTGELFHDRLQLRISLPHDFVQMRGADSRPLELVIGPTSINRFVLANVSDEQYSIVWSKALQERMHLFRARQTGFIKDAQMLTIDAWCFRVVVRQMPLQRARFDAGLGELVRRA